MKRLLVVIVIVVAAGAVVGLKFMKKSNGGNSPGYELALVEKQPMWIKVSATGLVEPIVQVEVKSKASGIVERLPIEMGDPVRVGQIIAELDPVEIQNQLDQEKAALAVASQTVRVREQDVRRTEELWKSGLVSEQDLENARLELEKAKSQDVSEKLAVANWEDKLADTVLRSPIDGIVLEKRVEIGQVISSGVSSYTGGTAIAVLANLDRVYVKAEVDESDIGRVKKGQRVEAVPDAFPDSKFTGIVERISPQSQIVQSVTTFEVVTALDNSEGLLKAGMNMTVDILVAGKDEALTVPRRAVRSVGEIPALAAILGIKPPEAKQLATREPGEKGSRPVEPGTGPASRPGNGSVSGNGGAKMVCVKTPEGYRFERVTVGLSDYDQYEVTQGLREGDEVVVFPTSRALDQSREFVERRRGMGIPGLSKSGSAGGGH